MTKKTDLQLFTKALAFAAHKHKDQKRKDRDKTPYINHPIALTNVLINEHKMTDTEILCSALLHDTVEDAEVTAEELTDLFGESISNIVMEVSDNKTLIKEQRKQAQIKHAPHLSTKAKAVKLADKICNLRDVIKCPPINWTDVRRQKYFEWSKQVIDGLRGEWSELELAFDDEYKNIRTIDSVGRL